MAAKQRLYNFPGTACEGIICLPSAGYNQIQSWFTDQDCRLIYCLHWSAPGWAVHGGTWLHLGIQTECICDCAEFPTIILWHGLFCIVTAAAFYPQTPKGTFLQEVEQKDAEGGTNISLFPIEILLKMRNRKYSPATSPCTNTQKSQFHHVLLPLGVGR